MRADEKSSARKGPDVFLSYKSEEVERAARIAEALQESGLDVWWDQHMVAGDEWPEQIAKRIDEAGVVVVLWTEASVGSSWVQREARRGEGRAALIPVLLDPVELPFEFGHIQTADLTEWEGEEGHAAFDGLLLGIFAALEREPPDPDPGGEKKRTRTRRRVTIALAGGFTAVASAALLWSTANGAADSVAMTLSGLEVEGVRFTLADAQTMDPVVVDSLLISAGDGSLSQVSVRPQEGEWLEEREASSVYLKASEGGRITLAGFRGDFGSIFEIQRTATESRLTPPAANLREVSVRGTALIGIGARNDTTIDFGPDGGTVFVAEDSLVHFDLLGLPRRDAQALRLFTRVDIVDLGLYRVESDESGDHTVPTILAGEMAAPWLSEPAQLAGRSLGLDSLVAEMATLEIVDDVIRIQQVTGRSVRGIRLGGEDRMPSSFVASGPMGQIGLLAGALAWFVALGWACQRAWPRRSRFLAGRR